MLNVTAKASEKISEAMKDMEDPHNVRIFLSEGGCCSGPSLGMALDEPDVNDEVIQDNNITYLIEKGLFEEVKPITIDFIESPTGSGFSITSKLSQGSSCGSCSSCS
jgi:iron-sulfur cluster assembly protein